MAKSLFSSLWYRVDSVQPRLRGHTDIHRHFYRDEVWYVLQDKVSGRYHRFSPAAYYLISLMDGERTLQVIWEEAVANLGDDAPTQDETIQLLGQLHSADVLASNVIPDSAELFERHRKQARQKLKQKLMSPLAIRFPLFDPEKVLARSLPFVRPLFSWFGVLIWLVVVGFALSQLGQHWSELTSNVADTVLTPTNLLLIWLVFPFVKGLHEFGHGYATKIWGGEVHEMGVMLLVFMPVPYVDASAASAFHERYKRVIVGASGMLVEVFVASLALFVWINAEQGIVHALAYNVILIAGVSTILFNANPLLRFDGYYILSDYLEIPNLGTRSNKYLGYLVQKYVLGIKQLTSPVASPGEPVWFVIYGITSFIYRSIIMVVIALFVATKFFFIGALLAIWAIANVFLIPMVKHTLFIFSSPRLHHQRNKVVSIFLGGIGAVTLIFFLMPAPLWTTGEAVIWLPENAMVRAGTSCFVDELLVKPGEKVSIGTPLLSCSDDVLNAEHKIMSAQKRELEIRYIKESRVDRLKAAITAVELEAIDEDLKRASERIDELIVRSNTEGKLSIPFVGDLPGRYFRKGEMVGYVVEPGPVTARLVVTQGDVALVRDRVKEVEVLVQDNGLHVLAGRIDREIPGASELLPSAALGTDGGGQIPVDPREPGGKTSFQKIFQFDIALPEEYRTDNYGRRVFVRINHGYEPLATQVFWAVREVFLNEFGV